MSRYFLEQAYPEVALIQVFEGQMAGACNVPDSAYLANLCSSFPNVQCGRVCDDTTFLFDTSVQMLFVVYMLLSNKMVCFAV